MTTVLIVSLLSISVLGFVVTNQVDRFLAKGGVSDSPPGRGNQGILLFGAPEVAMNMQKAGMKYRVISGLPIPEDGYYSALFALSNDDFGNLTVCRAAKCIDPGIYIVARCGVPELRDSFENAGVNRLLDSGEPADTLVAQIRGEGI